MIMREGTDTRDEIYQYERKMQAFRDLDAARAEISQYLPDDFCPEKELEEAMAQREEKKLHSED